MVRNLGIEVALILLYSSKSPQSYVRIQMRPLTLSPFHECLTLILQAYPRTADLYLNLVKMVRFQHSRLLVWLAFVSDILFVCL